MTGPLIALLFRQAQRIERQAAKLDRQEKVIANLRSQVRRLRSDAELVALCIPQDRRKAAMALVRDRHAVENLPEVGSE